jgi:flagellar hook assembly protein FlgD
LEIAIPTPVNITIYNIKGQRVRSLVDGLYEPGHHSVVWNGTDGNGRSVGSGVYLYRIVAGAHNATKKMVLMK